VVTQNYVNAIAGGDYVTACASLSTQARQALSAAMHSSGSCETLLARCLPPSVAVLNKDQVQLYYANVDARVSGSHAVVRTNGTAVANRVKEVTLRRRNGVWLLTSYGKERCPTGRARSGARPGHRKHK
jgi:hypothetical protein